MQVSDGPKPETLRHSAARNTEKRRAVRSVLAGSLLLAWVLETVFQCPSPRKDKKEKKKKRPTKELFWGWFLEERTHRAGRAHSTFTHPCQCCVVLGVFAAGEKCMIALQIAPGNVL